MSLDEDLRKLEREGAEPARLLIAKLRAGVLSRELIGLAASLNHSGAEEAAERLGIGKTSIERDQDYYNWENWNIRRAAMDSVVEEIEKMTPTRSSTLRIPQRILVSYACDATDHIIEQFESKYGPHFPAAIKIEMEGPIEIVAAARKWIAGEMVLNRENREFIRLRNKVSRTGNLHYAAYYTINAAAENSYSGTLSNVAYATGSAIYWHANSEESLASRKLECQWQMHRLAEYALGEI